MFLFYAQNVDSTPIFNKYSLFQILITFDQVIRHPPAWSSGLWRLLTGRETRVQIPMPVVVAWPIHKISLKTQIEKK